MKVSPTANAVTTFFAKTLNEPDTDLVEFIEAVSVSLGSTIGLRINEEGHELVLEQTIQQLTAGFDVGRESKPIADWIRDRKGTGIHLLLIQGNKK